MVIANRGHRVETDGPPIISVRGLRNSFGDQVIHEGLDLDVRRGEIIGVVGGSGTGKSVLMRSIIGLQIPDEGSIQVLGRSITDAEDDDDIDIRDWKEVVWAMTTRVDPIRDMTLVDRTPIDYLDFASPISGLGSKVGIDATNKWPGETTREWGTAIAMDADVKARVDSMWSSLGL